MNNNQKAFIAMSLMVALAFVAVVASNLATPITAAKPVPVPGESKSNCAKSQAGSGAATCPSPVLPPRGP
jgi:hypothetical protein